MEVVKISFTDISIQLFGWWTLESTWKDDRQLTVESQKRICVAGKSCFKGMHANWTEIYNKVFDMFARYITSLCSNLTWQSFHVKLQLCQSFKNAGFV